MINNKKPRDTDMSLNIKCLIKYFVVLVPSMENWKDFNHLQF